MGLSNPNDPNVGSPFLVLANSTMPHVEGRRKSAATRNTSNGEDFRRCLMSLELYGMSFKLHSKESQGKLSQEGGK